MERTYVMIKPHFANFDEVINEIKNRIDLIELNVLTEGFIRYTRDDAKQHYAEHVEKSFYPGMEDYIVSDKAYGMIVEGENAIAKIRSIIGSTIKKDKETGAIILPEVGTIRRDIPDMLGEVCCMPGNVMHASDSQSSAEIEIAIFEKIIKRQKSQESSK